MNTFVRILTDINFLGAFLQTVILIFLGFILRRKNILEQNSKKVLTTLVWKITVPCFAFNAFMQDFDYINFKSSLKIFVLAFLIYIIIILLGKLIFIKKGKTISTLGGLFFAIGQTTLFSMPILQSIYESHGEDVMLYISTISIVFRIFVYIVGFTLISGEKISRTNIGPTLKKIFVTPVMIGMFAGIIVFLIQNITPQISTASGNCSFLRIDKTLPALYLTVKTLSKMMGPVAMLLIGVTLGESNFASAFKDRLAWIFAVLRNICGPAIVLLICFILNKTGIFIFTEHSVISIVIAFSAPISVSLSVICVQFHKEEKLASRACLISTLLTAITLPLAFVATYIIFPF